MADDTGPSLAERGKKKMKGNGSVSSAVYGLGFLGALVYYIQHATSFWDGVLGFLTALVWPAMLVYRLLEYLQM